MNDKRPLILISNDDGYRAKGINDLADMARPFGDIVIAAPDGPRSGAAMSITSREPVRASLISEEPGLTVYSCSGTPDDCVKLAMQELLPRTPDLVLGGINHGDNSGINAHYSGTMAIVLEAAMKGVSAIAFSSCHTSWSADFSPMRPYVERVIRHVLDRGLPRFTCLNVNAPALPEFKGMKTCAMGMGDWTNEWEKRCDPRGRDYYWLTGSFVPDDPDDPRTDKWALANGYVAVSPVKLDMTDYDCLSQLDFQP